MTLPLFSTPIAWPGNWKSSLSRTFPQAPAKPSYGGFKVVLNPGKRLLQTLINIAMLMLLLIGAGTVWDATVGDGALPHLNNVKHLSNLAQMNSTASMTPQTIRPVYWEALAPSRNLLLSLSPQIALWLQDLHQRGHIETREPGDIHQTYHVSDETALLAAYRFTQDTLYLGDDFWKLSDGQKVAVITHEYRHSRQNPGKRISYQMAQWLGMGQLQSQTPMENEAMDYERQAQSAMGMN